MTENDFHTAFQQQVLNPLAIQPTNMREIALEAARRDQRRVRILAGLSVLCWLLGILGMVPMVIGLNQLMMEVRLSGVESKVDHQGEENPPLVEANRKVVELARSTQLLHETFPVILASLAALFLAALFTVLLIFSSRRATLNRINVSLAQICEQLKDLRPPVDSGGKQSPNTG